MSRFTSTMDAAYFEDLYRSDADPWKFETSAYERRKYAATLTALPQDLYRRALEIGCSIGVLTDQLALRCERLTAIDGSPTALAAARRRCTARPNVDFREMMVPRDFPMARYDLIVVSELIYFLDRADVLSLADKCGEALTGTVLLVHWTGKTNYPLSGDEASELFIDAMRPNASVEYQAREPNYRLDLLRAMPATIA